MQKPESDTDASVSRTGIHANAIRPTKEILLKVLAGRERKHRADDENPVKQDLPAHQFHSPGWRRRSAAERGHDQLHKEVHRRRVGPPQYRDDVVLQVDPRQIAAGTPGAVALRRGTRVKAAPSVEPP